jgi:hypothetical protein
MPSSVPRGEWGDEKEEAKICAPRMAGLSSMQLQRMLLLCVALALAGLEAVAAAAAASGGHAREGGAGVRGACPAMYVLRCSLTAQPSEDHSAGGRHSACHWDDIRDAGWWLFAVCCCFAAIAHSPALLSSYQRFPQWTVTNAPAQTHTHVYLGQDMDMLSITELSRTFMLQRTGPLVLKACLARDSTHMDIPATCHSITVTVVQALPSTVAGQTTLPASTRVTSTKVPGSKKLSTTASTTTPRPTTTEAATKKRNASPTSPLPTSTTARGTGSSGPASTAGPKPRTGTKFNTPTTATPSGTRTTAATAKTSKTKKRDALTTAALPKTSKTKKKDALTTAAATTTTTTITTARTESTTRQPLTLAPTGTAQAVTATVAVTPSGTTTAASATASTQRLSVATATAPAPASSTSTAAPTTRPTVATTRGSTTTHFVATTCPQPNCLRCVLNKQQQAICMQCSTTHTLFLGVCT